MKYKNLTTSWDQKSTVRSKPHRSLSLDELSRKWLYSPELLPMMKHPMVKNVDRSKKQKIYALCILNHLNFTNYLEHEIVCQTVYNLARNPVVDLSIEMRRDAYRIYVDESYHSLMVGDFQFQVEALMGVKAANAPPPFYWDVKNIINELPAQLQEKARLCVVVISETLISKLLDTLPKDDSVIQGVRDLIADHAHDEAYHHYYFTRIFQEAWPQFSEFEKIKLGCLFPRFISSFLSPDIDFFRSCLRNIGLTSQQATAVLADSYGMDKTAGQIRMAATSTLKLFQRYGLFEYDMISTAFAEYDLLPKFYQHAS